MTNDASTRGPHTRDLPATAPLVTAGGLSTSPGSAADLEPVPETVGRYEIVGEIARGGMGIVYRSRDPGLSREVAVKLVRTAYRKSPAAVRRFLDEATITGPLQHPGIPPVHEVGTLADGSPFLAMKLIKGQTLEQLLARRHRAETPLARVGGSPNLIAVFEHICQAVGNAHAHNVIRRDLKPANVMVGAFGEVQVMDWGLARVLASGGVHPRRDGIDPKATVGTEIQSLRGEDSATQAGSLLGTPAFMPPEQAMGAIDEIDARGDVFGLGAILCVILTGRPPYVGPDSEAIRKLAVRGDLDDALARLSECGADPDLAALCRRCLSIKRTDRPADGEAVAAAVAALRAAADERVRQAELARARAEEWTKRRRVQLLLAGAMVLLMGAASPGYGRSTRGRSRRPRRLGERPRLLGMASRMPAARPRWPATARRPPGSCSSASSTAARCKWRTRSGGRTTLSRP